MYTIEMQRMMLVSVLLNRSVSMNWMILALQYPTIMLPKMWMTKSRSTWNSKRKENEKKKNSWTITFVSFVDGICVYPLWFAHFLSGGLDLQQMGVSHERLTRETLRRSPSPSAAWGLFIQGQPPGASLGEFCEKPVTSWKVNVHPKDTWLSIQIQIFYKLRQGQANLVQDPHQPAVPLWPLPPARVAFEN